jgi:preprotein translocase subunit SecE
MAKINPFEFLQQVRNEANKVTWPSRKEVGLTTMMVFIMAALASVFFLFTDFTIQKLLSLILSIGA